MNDCLLERRAPTVYIRNHTWSFFSTLLLAFAAAVMALSPLHGGEGENDYLANVTNGLTLLEKGDYSAAVDAFIKAQGLAPDDFLAHTGIATAALYLGDRVAALSEFRAALRVNPHSSVAYNGLGICYLFQNIPNDAVVNFGNAVRQDPTYADAYVNLAYAYCLEHKPREAMEQCLNAQRAGAEGLFFLQVQAMTHSLLGNTDNAILALRRLLQKVRPTEALRWLILTPPTPNAFTAAGAKDSEILRQVQISQPKSSQALSGARVGVSGYPGEREGFSVAERAGGAEIAGVTRFVASSVISSAEGRPDGIAFITFIVDGATRAVTNTPPFAWDWDTTEEQDGEHLLIIRAYSKSKSLIGERRLAVRVKNSCDPRRVMAAPNYTPQQEEHATARLKKCLQLSPNLLHARYLLAQLYEEKGLAEFALSEYTQVFLEQNDYLDTREKIHTLKRHLGKAFSPGQLIEINAVADVGKRVALTFDDGPRPPYTRQILNLLKKFNARATFFVVGKMAELYPDDLRAIVAAGHELASHSYSHRRMTELSDVEIEDEILRTEAIVREIADRTTEYFRPPGGHYNQKVREALMRLGYKAIFWGPNITSFSGLSPKQIADELLQQVQPGCIILLHNGEDETVPVLPMLLAGLEAQGYEMVTMTELLTNGKALPRQFAWK